MPGTPDNLTPPLNAKPHPLATYDDAVQWIFERINYERAQAGTYSSRDFKLDRMAELLRRLGDPQKTLPAVHIAGTKGKGSTAVMAAGILQHCGYKTGLFTSPHIERFEERMQVDGREPTADLFLQLSQRCFDIVSALDDEANNLRTTYFEICTALAWLYFVNQDVDIVVLEVGLGGRLDATNLCSPEVCLITNISRDHTAILGKTEEKIAAEKAGIVKAGIPVITGSTHAGALEVIRNICQQRNAPLTEPGPNLDFEFVTSHTSTQELIDVTIHDVTWNEIPVPLAGAHQARNTALAISAVHVLKQRGYNIDIENVRAGLTQVKWPVRIELVSDKPVTIIDAAHNEASCQALVETLEHFPQRPRTLVLAATRGKDVRAMLRVLLPAFERIVLTQYQRNPRFVPLDRLVEMTKELGGNAQTAATPAAALSLARSITNEDELICITGSFFVAAEARALFIPDND